MKVEYKYDESDKIPYLENIYYHHPLKGCETITYKTKHKSGYETINKKCLTHGIRCSKTGWQLGWYMGTKSSLGIDLKCQKCGIEFEAQHEDAKYCKKCGIEVNRERSKRRYDPIKRKEYLKKYKESLNKSI